MKQVSVGSKDRDYLVPTTWAEGEKMITDAMKFHEGRGRNLHLKNTCALIVFGMFGEEMMAADPTQALCYLIRRICEREGAGLERREA